jgi:hypothetical protein
MSAPAILDTIRVNWSGKRPLDELAAVYGAVGYWRLGETSGTIAYDLRGGNHGTYTGGFTLGAPALYYDEADGATSFNGTTGYVTVPDANSLDLGDNFTLFAIVKRGALGAAQGIISKQGSAYYLRLDSTGHPELRSGASSIVLSPNVLDANTHVIVATKSGATARLYVDGVQVAGTTASAVTCLNNTSALLIGQGGPAADFWGGTLDEVMVFPTALSRAQVAALSVSALQGEFGGPYDTITARVNNVTQDWGRNDDFSAEQTGQLVLALDNADEFFTPNRNLCSNPSLEAGLADWVSSALASLTAAATDLLLVADPATGGGTLAGEASLSATLNSGVYIPIDNGGQPFPSGQPVTVAVQIKSISGTTSVEVGLASSGTPADKVSSASTITGAYATYTVTWTPSANRSDAVLFIRTTVAAAAVIHFDQVQVNTGATANPFLLGPVKRDLQPGAPVHWYATSAGVDKPLFYGNIKRVTPNPDRQTAEITAQDKLGSLDINVDVATFPSSGYSVRWALIDAAIRKLFGSYRNLCANGNFETNTAGWALTGTAARSNAAAQFGTWSLKVPGESTAVYNSGGTAAPIHLYTAGTYYTASFYARLVGLADTLTVTWGGVTLTTGQGNWPTLTTTLQRYSITWLGNSSPAQLSFALSSLDAARGVYIDGVMISEGLDVPAYVDFGAPYGRQANLVGFWASAEAGPVLSNGWSNRCSNPEAATDLTGWWRTSDAQVLTTGSTGAAGSILTASVTPGANRLVLVVVGNTHGTTANAVTLTGNGLTYVQIGTLQFNGVLSRLSVFRAMGAAPTAGSITITVGGAQTATGIGWTVWEINGVDTTGTNGSGAIVQSPSATGNSTNPTAVMAAFSGIVNSTFKVAASHGGAPSAPSDWLSQSQLVNASPAMTSMIAYDNNAAQVQTAATGQWAAFGIELKWKASITANIVRLPGGTFAAGVTGLVVPGGFPTAIQTTGTRKGNGVVFPVSSTWTFRSGKSYTLSTYIDQTPGAGLVALQVGSLGSGDQGAAQVQPAVTASVGLLAFATWSPSADRTDGAIVVKANTWVSPTATLVAFTGVGLWPGTHTYARTGITSPSPLDEANGITSVVDGASHAECTNILTYAQAGSGAYIQALDVMRLTGATVTVVIKARVTAGTASVAFGIGYPFGAIAADLASATVTLTTSFQTITFAWTATGDGFADYAMLYVMTTAAAAINIRVDDVSVYLGTSYQPFIPVEAAGVDIGEVDIIPANTYASASAISALGDLNKAQLGRHWVEATRFRPFWRYVSSARRSASSKAVAEAYVDITSVTNLDGFELDGDQIVNAVVVKHSSNHIDPTTGALSSSTSVVRAYDQSAVDRARTVRLLEAGDIKYVNGPGADTTAQDIADLLLRRYKVARARPSFGTRNRDTAALDRKPDDLISLTSLRARTVAQRFTIQSIHREVSLKGFQRDTSFKLEEFVI